MTEKRKRGRPSADHRLGAETPRPIGERLRSQYDFEGSLYRVACPSCGAPPMHWCVAQSGRRIAYAHALRVGSPAKERESEE
jgi:hypothetical protein